MRRIIFKSLCMLTLMVNCSMIAQGFVTNQPADIVVGQASINGQAPNQGGAPNSNTLNDPFGVSCYGAKLFIADRANNRVLIFNQVPLSDDAAADVVIGQPDFISAVANNGGVSAQSLSNPTGVYCDGRKLFIADQGNNRVLIFNTIPSVNFAAADCVVGQSSMSVATPNTGGVKATTLSAPQNVFSDGQRLFVADYNNHRVLIYSSIPSGNGAAANIVVGQASMTSNGTGVSAQALAHPYHVFYDGTRCYISDMDNRRVLIYNQLPQTNAASADVVIGQPDMTTNTFGNRSQRVHAQASGLGLQ